MAVLELPVAHQALRRVAAVGDRTLPPPKLRQRDWRPKWRSPEPA